MKILYAVLPLLVVLCLSTQPTYAQAPFSIEADQDLVWDQANALYRAQGNVVLTNGDIVVRAENIEARYDPAKGQNAITTITAMPATGGQVQLQGAQWQGKGQKLVYDLPNSHIVLHGPAANLANAEWQLTAAQQIAFNHASNVANAQGNVVLNNAAQKRRITAPNMQANFSRAANGNLTLNTAQAKGGVTITAPQIVATAHHANFNSANNTATLQGNVLIKRAANELRGEKAEFNLATGYSQIIGGQSADGTKQRVRAVFFPQQGQ